MNLQVNLQELYAVIEAGYGVSDSDIKSMLKELKALREATKTLAAAAEEAGYGVSDSDIKSMLKELKALREATKTLAAAAEEAVRLLKPTCVSYGGPNPCYCHGGSFDQGVPIEPPHIERECYITDKLEQALKKDK